MYGTTSGGTFLPALVDSSGRLLVSVAGGTIIPTEINLPASTCADPALSEVGALTTGISFTATPSILNCINGTAATTLTGSALTLGNSVALAWSDISVSRLSANVLGLASGDSLSLVSGYIEGAEQAAPAAPAANGYRIFAQDNGAGKTQLMVIFGSGSAQQIAIEP